jgi:hypothetical protein
MQEAFVLAAPVLLHAVVAQLCHSIKDAQASMQRQSSDVAC